MEANMRNVVLGIAAATVLATAIPAHAQVYFGAGPGGVEIEAGRPYYRDRDDDWRGPRRHWNREYAYSRGGCRTVRQRIETPSGRIIFKTRRYCY